MKFLETKLKGAYLIELNKLLDDRGFFAREFCKREFEEFQLCSNIVQINVSFNKFQGTLRGMHYQLSPKAEDKIIRCVNGSIFDVIIDIRENSETLGKWVGAILSSENRSMFYVPKGFAHGFQTLEENTEILYYHTEYYHPELEEGIRYDDPGIGISWPLPITNISDRDSNFTLITETFKGVTL